MSDYGNSYEYEDGYKPVQQTEGAVMAEGVLQRFKRIAANPAAASDSDKLRALADWHDAYDAAIRGNSEETDVQDWLRDLADRLAK